MANAIKARMELLGRVKKANSGINEAHVQNYDRPFS